MRALVLTLSALVAPAPQDAPPVDPHAACAATGWVPREILERPVSLRSGTGNARERVTTASPEAQAFYDQGLDYLHGYVWIEAARSFHQALRIDPGLAMAQVGLSRVFSGLDDPEAARKALARARELAANASPRERRRVALRELQLDAIADLGDSQKHLRYKKALDDALAAVGAGRLLWGADLTLETGLARLWALDVIAVTPADRERIRWRNAASLFPPGSFPGLSA